MFRLTPPTKGTFWLSLVGMAVGIVTSSEIALVSGLEQYAFWFLAGGAVLLVLGVVFNRI